MKACEDSEPSWIRQSSSLPVEIQSYSYRSRGKSIWTKSEVQREVLESCNIFWGHDQDQVWIKYCGQGDIIKKNVISIFKRRPWQEVAKHSVFTFQYEWAGSRYQFSLGTFKSVTSWDSQSTVRAYSCPSRSECGFLWIWFVLDLSGHFRSWLG